MAENSISPEDFQKHCFFLENARQWLDFTMWFILEFPDDEESVRYDWFVTKYDPKGRPSYPFYNADFTERFANFIRKYEIKEHSTIIFQRMHARNETGSDEERIPLAPPLEGWRLERYCQIAPAEWVAKWFTDDKRDIPIKGFIGAIKSELETRHGLILLDGLSIYGRVTDTVPTGENIKEMHDNYLDMRKKITDRYFELVAENPDENRPFAKFPNPVLLPKDKPHTAASPESPAGETAGTPLPDKELDTPTAKVCQQLGFSRPHLSNLEKHSHLGIQHRKEKGIRSRLYNVDQVRKAKKQYDIEKSAR
jgi:hypothetical protein